MSDRPEWDRCKHWIEAALVYTRGTHELSDIEAGIESGQFIFWAGKNSAIITEILQYPRKRVLNYFLIGGDLRELRDDLEPKITLWAKMNGCDAVSGVGRRGFERAFAKSGFKLAWLCIYKEV